MCLSYTYITTPVGQLLLAGQGDVVHYVGFPQDKIVRQLPSAWRRDDTVLPSCQRQLGEYFAGQRRTFDLVLNPQGTDFQKLVWQQLQSIAFGRVCSYQDLAIAIDRPKAARAVGAANGKNPIAVIIPCHRVVGANGTLTGFSGGLDVKQQLLELEGIIIDGERQRALF
ncbi:MAG: methylated-DNA--[protein]-cysteine S-methyltransferase [Gammaproteobacteria bacterium]|jgi:methylated-DNA-[protein]-cysteine S-methyltransferase|nr:methylated-DNA--[protein]-cysteine S-methyltransferase [Gammaproteobacteria bacterium]